MANSTSKYVVLVKWASGATEQLEIPTEPWPGRHCPLLEVGPRDQEPCATVPVYSSTGPVLAEVIVHGLEIPSMIVCPAPAPTHELRVTWPDGRVDRHACRTGDVVGPIGPAGSFEREFTVDATDARVMVRVRGEAPRMVLLSVASTPAPEPEPKTETDLAPVCARCDSEPPCASCPELATLVPDDQARVPEWLTEAMSEAAQRHDLRSIEGNEKAMTEIARMSDDYGLKCRSCASLARGYRSCASALAAAHDGDETASASHHEAAGRHFREALELARKAEELAA